MPSLFDVMLGATWRRLTACLCLFAWIACGLSAATRILPLSVAADRSTGRATLPAGTTIITLQSREPRGEWRDVETRAAQPGPLVLSLPSSVKNTSFRVNVTVEAVSRTKFPAAFYKGRNTFGPSQKTAQGNMNRMAMAVLDTVSMAVQASPVATDTPEEADIWKISGTTAYFFNQLRGLQVIDLGAPAAPKLVASVRLPASGQDLYLLPANPGFQDVLLVTTEQSPDDYTTWTNLQVVRVQGAVASIVQTARVAGYPQSSRLLGRRLFLCTTDSTSGGQTTLSEWLIPSDAAPSRQNQIALAGYFGTLAAGADWLAVAMTPTGQWNLSSVSVFQLGESGLRTLTAAPVALSGRINDQYKIQWRAGVLTTITQAWLPGGGTLSTRLENFQADGPAADGHLLGNLELARGDSLHATRFAGDKAYIVTFRSTDPLFVVSLADAANPVIAGHVEVPGWSTHIEPVGDKLFTVGWEAGAVTASLFDVSNPAAPALLRRLALTNGYSYSEANWDPQALQVLPDAGLAMVPLTSYNGNADSNGVRLVDIDLAGGDLKLRGLIPGRFAARRAALVGDAAVTLSQRTLVTATIADRDHPVVLADTLLAWPVDRVLPAGDRLLAVETGGAWDGGAPTVRTSPLAAPDNVLAELPLQTGYVHDVALRDGRLYVLRETGSVNNAMMCFWIARLGQLHLDVYDAADPLALRLLGSCSWDAGTINASRTTRLLWPRSNRPVVILENDPYYYWWGPVMIEKPILMTGAVSGITATRATAKTSRLSAPSLPWPGRGQPHLLAFDVTDPAAPSAGTPLPLAEADVTLTDSKTADAGLVVIGVDQWQNHDIRRGLVTTSEQSELVHSVQVIDVPASGEAGVRPLIDLPGSLFAVSELGRDGFLAYTRTLGDSGNGAIQVSACDGRDAFQVAQAKLASLGTATASGRTLFYATDKGVQRRRLTDAGQLTPDGLITSTWAPAEMRVTNGQLLASNGRRLLAAPVADKNASAATWTFSLYFSLENVERAADGSWIVPMGDYGCERVTP